MPTGVAAFIADADENTARITPKGHINLTESYDIVKNPSRLRITSLSGGTQFPTVSVGKLTIRSESGNNIMFIGGIVDDSPYSGRGLDLWGGESITLPVQNMNQIRVFAATSGQMISMLGFGTAGDVALDTDDPIFIDTTPPVISTTYPANGATNIELNDTIYADFTEAIASGTHNFSGFTVRLSGSSVNVSGTVYRDTLVTNRLVFDTKVNLSGSRIYIARIGTQIKDLTNNAMTTSGSWSFTTIGTPPPADTTRPVVSGHSPLSGATSVAIAVSPTMTMSEAIQSTTVSGFFLVNISGSAAVAASTTLGADSKTVTINPTVDLTYSKMYQLRALSGIKDIAGNNLNTPVTGRFTTIAAPSAPLTIVYNVTGDSENSLFDGDDEYEAEWVGNAASTLIGDKIQQVRVTLRQEGTVVGDVNCYIFKADGTRLRIGDALDASTVTASEDFADYTFTFATANTYALVLGDRVGIEFGDPSSDSDNCIQIKRNGSNVVPNATRTHSSDGTSWSDDLDREFAGIMWAT